MPARNGVRLAPVTPPTALGAKVPFGPPGSSDAKGRLPGRNELEKLNTLKMLALGSTVNLWSQTLILTGQATLKSSDFNQGKFCASGLTCASCGMTQPRAFMSFCVITGIGPPPGQDWLPTRH